MNNRDSKGRFLKTEVKAFTPEDKEIKSYVGPSISSIFGLMQAQAQGVMVDPYYQNTWVKACVDAIGNAVSALPIVYNTGEFNSPLVKENSKLREILERPSAQASSSADLFKWTTLYLDAYGSAVWLMRGREDRAQDPEAIVIVNGRNFKPVLNEQKWIIGWKWQSPNGKEIELGYHEVIRFAYPNPSYPFEGLAPYAAAVDGILSDFKAAQFNQAFFDNSGVVSGILTSKEMMDENALELMRRAWSNKYSGADNAFKVAALEQGTEFEPINLSHKDMLYIELRKYSRDEVLASYNTSKSILGLLEDQNKANAEEARKAFHVNTVRPRTILIAQTLWAEWLQYRPERVWLFFDDTGLEFLQSDKRNQILTAAQLFGMGWSKNQINDWMQLGMDLSNDPTADEQFVRTGVKTMTEALAEPVEGEDIKALLSSVKALLVDIKNPKIEIKAVPKVLFDEKKMADELMKLLGPALTSAAKKSFEFTLTDLGKAKEAFEPQAAAWRKFFNTKALKISTIPVRWHKALKNVIKNQIAGGATTSEIATALKLKFKDHSEAWAVRIADTEVMDVLDGARYETMVKEEVPYHGWVSSQDAHVRTSHRINGEIVKVGEPFSNGLRYPHDPSAGPGEVINCRCTTFPSMEPKSVSLFELGIKSIKVMEVIRKPLEKEATDGALKWFALILKATLKALGE